MQLGSKGLNLNGQLNGVLVLCGGSSRSLPFCTNLWSHCVDLWVRLLVNRTGLSIIMFCHLRRPKRWGNASRVYAERHQQTAATRGRLSTSQTTATFKVRGTINCAFIRRKSPLEPPMVCPGKFPAHCCGARMLWLGVLPQNSPDFRVSFSFKPNQDSRYTAEFPPRHYLGTSEDFLNQANL